MDTDAEPRPRARRRESRRRRLPPGLLRQARSRLAQLAVILALVSIGTVFIRLAVGAVSETLSLLLLLAPVALDIVVYVVASSRRVSRNNVVRLGLFYEVLRAFLMSLGTIEASFAETGSVPAVTWTAVLIALFPLVVPAVWTTTLFVAILAAATKPLSLLLLSHTGFVAAMPADYLLTTVSPAFAVALAVLGSRIVFGLNRDAVEAQKLGAYHLDSRIGKGGMGEVWRARHRMLARPAAIKLIRQEEDLANATALARFEREAQVTATLKSPHTVELFDFGVANDGTIYYVMELLDGLDLQTLVDEYGPIEPERVVHLIRQVCDSIGEAHSIGLVHRDLKPANIFVCRKGLITDFVKVLDFGLVGLQRNAELGNTEPGTLTRKGALTGTPAYMAPEMARRGQVDGRADIYQLGCVIFFLLTGHLVFEGMRTVRMAMAHLGKEPPRPSNVTDRVIPAALEDLVLACLEKDPARRPQSAEELSQRLDGIVFENDWTTVRARGWWDQHLPAATDIAKAVRQAARRRSIKLPQSETSDAEEEETAAHERPL